jgi:ribosomal protein S7
MAVPAGLTGQGLLQLNSTSLALLFAGDIRAARQEEEGTAWIIESEDHRQHASMAEALWTVLRRENHSAVATAANAEASSHVF